MSRWTTYLFAVPIMPRIGPAQFAALEAERLTSTAESDDPPVVPMSGGQGPAGAAKHSDPRFPGASYCPRCGLFAYPIHKCIGATPP